MDNAGAPTLPTSRQVVSVALIEFHSILRPRRSALAYLLAALPVGVACAARFLSPADVDLARANFAGIFYNLLLGATVFLGCAFVFTRHFRSEILLRTLHYYLLAPIRREALLLGKYLAGLLFSWALFGAAAIATSVLLFGAPTGWFASLVADVGTTLIACMAYGAVFLVFSVLFRNPILPVAALFVWESLHFLLPSALQALSVRHYLGALTATPLPVPDGPFAILAVVPSPWSAVLALAGLTAAGLALGAWRLRRLEIRYTED